MGNTINQITIRIDTTNAAFEKLNDSYTLEQLKTENPGGFRPFDIPHDVDNDDLKIVIALREALAARRRGALRPVAGDAVIYTSEYGDYHPGAMIDRIDEGKVTICECPSAYCLENGKVSISGGSFSSVEASELVYIGEKPRRFWTFGRFGACAHGGIYFTAPVHEWRYVAANPLYGEYTTEKHRKFYVAIIEDEKERTERHNGYKYLISSCGGCSCNAFRTDHEFSAWIKTYKVKIFSEAGISPVAFACRVNTVLLDKVEYDRMQLPEDTRLLNASIIRVKVAYDAENNILTEYRYHNRNNGEYDLYPRPYMLAELGRYI